MRKMDLRLLAIYLVDYGFNFTESNKILDFIESNIEREFIKEKSEVKL